VKLTLVTRADCGLCIDAVRALRELGLEYDLADVDADPRLLALYDEAVPVILADGRELCRAPVTTHRLRSAIEAVRLK
jgi:glutaredoxin